MKLISLDEKKRQQATRGLIEEQYRVVEQPSRYWISEIFDFALKSDRAVANKIAKDAELGAVKAVMLFKLGEIDEAVELAAALSESTSRSRTFLAGSEAVDSKDQKKQLLLEASFHAKTIQNAERRVETYASIIEALCDNGNEETARSLAKLRFRWPSR